jgi:hypothetical protein
MPYAKYANGLERRYVAGVHADAVVAAEMRTMRASSALFTMSLQ